jgi:hypothetical protein
MFAQLERVLREIYEARVSEALISSHFEALRHELALQMPNRRMIPNHPQMFDKSADSDHFPSNLALGTTPRDSSRQIRATQLVPSICS